MNNFIKHLLLPFTALLWYFISYYIVWTVITGLVFIFNFHWAWLIILGVICMVIIIAMIQLPTILNDYLLSKLYNFSWLSIIAHGIAGGIGVFGALNEIYGKFSIRVFWNFSPYKTMILIIPAILIIYVMVLSLAIKPFIQNYYINDLGIKKQC
jgi:hypothetical protein